MGKSNVGDTVMARVSAWALINFKALLPPALIQDRRLCESWRLLFSGFEIEFIHFLSMKALLHIGVQYIV